MVLFSPLIKANPIKVEKSVTPITIKKDGIKKAYFLSGKNL